MTSKSTSVTESIVWSQDKPEPAKRDVSQAMLRGAIGHCPHCNKGKLFTKYLKVTPQCSECHENYTPNRSDDLPAYLVLLIVGHIVVGGMMSVEANYDWPTQWHSIVWPVLCTVLTLVLLPPVKGAVVALQWALRMHGFSNQPDGDELPALRPAPHHDA